MFRVLQIPKWSVNLHQVRRNESGSSLISNSLQVLNTEVDSKLSHYNCCLDSTGFVEIFVTFATDLFLQIAHRIQSMPIKSSYHSFNHMLESRRNLRRWVRWAPVLRNNLGVVRTYPRNSLAKLGDASRVHHYLLEMDTWQSKKWGPTSNYKEE